MDWTFIGTGIGYILFGLVLLAVSRLHPAYPRLAITSGQNRMIVLAGVFCLLFGTYSVVIGAALPKRA